MTTRNPQPTPRFDLGSQPAVSRRAFLSLGAALTGPTALSARRRPGAAPVPSAALPDRQPDSSEQLRGVPATLLCDALTRLGFDRTRFTLSREIRPTVRTPGTMMGPAVTTKYETGADGTLDDIRRFVFDPVDAAGPGAVWVIESGTDDVVSMLGELIAVACRRIGLAGIVTDGGCRDIDAIAAIGLPLFSKGTVLYGPGSIIRPVAADVPVRCGGVEVRPGDLVAADADGALVVPREAVGDVATLVAELRAKEDRTRAALARGDTLRDAYVF